MLKKAVNILVWVLVTGAIISLSYFIYLERTLPDPESIALRKVTESTKIYDSTGQVLLYDIHGEEKRTIVPWDQIPDSIKKATLASEDNEFYSHKGLDVTGIGRAIIEDIRHLSFSQGGSTITQQLVKTTLLGSEKTLSRKIRELLLAIEIERKFTKDQIFWMYLNQIPYGSNAYGVEAAAKTFFAKKASDLTLAESAILATLPRAPSYYSPYGNHVSELMSRKDLILGRMKTIGYITPEQYAQASKQRINFASDTESLSAPHFVIMVKEYLESKYGQDIVENGGLKITTTLNSSLQQIAEDVVSKYSAINKDHYKASNAALVAIDPKTGEILALVGSQNYFDVANEGNFNVATALRQPGSSFKPFAYAVAFQKGYTDYTTVYDNKTEFNPLCTPDALQVKDSSGNDCYHPQNYDERFRGPVTLRQGLSQSLNVPSVKTLYLAGVPDTIDLAEKMGITTLGDRSRFGLSLVLGGAEVKLVDLVSAYSVFANDGIRNPWVFIKKIEAPDGSTVEQEQLSPNRVLNPQIARLISDVLSDNNSRSSVFGYSSPLYIPGKQVAAKTGTTQENRDAWVIGYYPALAAGVWAGNNKNDSMTKSGAGISAAGPMWHEFMTRAFDIIPAENFPKPDPIPSPNKPVLDGSTSNLHSILYYTDRNNPLGYSPKDPSIDPQFDNWEWAVSNHSGQ